jgi:CheY-like chemotaxis protein
MDEYHQVEQGRPAVSSGTPVEALPKYGVLVVDDEECVRGVLNAGLRAYGFTVWPAADGREALDLYRRHGESIDVVLLDVRMPGLDGPQTLAALQGLDPRIRCAFMSGNLGRYTERTLRASGAAAVLQKPLCLEEVAEMLWVLVRCADRRPCLG